MPDPKEKPDSPLEEANWLTSASTQRMHVLDLALRAGRIGMWTRDLVNDRAEWTPQLHEIFGTTPENFDTSSEAILRLVHEDDRAAVQAALKESLNSRGDFVQEFRIKPSGAEEVRWVAAHGRPICDETGKPVQFNGMAIDITERKRAELLRSHLAAIVENSDDAIISKRLDQTIISWNRGAERVFGYTAEEMIGQPIMRIIPKHLQNEELDIIAKLRRGERIDHFETVRLTKDGRLLNVSISVSPVRDESGRIVAASKIARDITGLKASQAALRESDEKLRAVAKEREILLESERSARSEAERLGHMKDEFLATLSHEIRTPLNAIQGWATLLRHAGASAEDRQRGLEAIERNARAQSQIINDLLDMNRIVAGKMHLEVQPMRLHEVIEAAAEAVRPSANAKRLRIRTILDSSIGATRGDPNRLQQVMWNLLTNSVKFTPAGGFVQVVLERVNSHVEISVQDSGAGISAEFLPHVFDRFRQADATTTRKHGGLGLGLSIVRTLVELHGGSVRVRSPGENLGSTFVVSLPVISVDASSEHHDERLETDIRDIAVVDLPRLDGVRVLIVDDEEDGRTLLARILQGRGANVVCVNGAPAALNTIKNQRFDVILSDIGMPEVDGYELMRQIRGLGKPLSQIPAIAVTAYARSEDRQRSLLAGFQMHISKPLETPELIAAIASQLQMWRQ
jgi:PAS domain S-box-containing protein